MDSTLLMMIFLPFAIGWLISELVTKRLQQVVAMAQWASERRTEEANKLRDQLNEMRSILVSIGIEVQRR